MKAGREEFSVPDTDAKYPLKRKARRVPHSEMFQDSEYMHGQLDRLIFALEAFREGDISVRLSKERNDKFADLTEAYNTMVEMIGGVSTEVSRISRVGGIEGNLDARAEFKAATGRRRDPGSPSEGRTDLPKGSHLSRL